MDERLWPGLRGRVAELPEARRRRRAVQRTNGSWRLPDAFYADGDPTPRPVAFAATMLGLGVGALVMTLTGAPWPLLWLGGPTGRTVAWLWYREGARRLAARGSSDVGPDDPCGRHADAQG